MTLSLAAMEPLFPDTQALAPLAFTFAREAAALGGQLHQITRRGVAELLRAANTYHSNLIEGHDSRPREVERALHGKYAADPVRRVLQQEALAHLEVQRLVERRLDEESAPRITSAEFLCWVHGEFYRRLPDELRVVSDQAGTRRVEVVPGTFRTEELIVGRHLPPDAEQLTMFLDRFEHAYDPERQGPLEAIVAAAASHHRLLWIHPFTDGNGRVARLFTDAYLRRISLGGHGLWTASRGLARRRRDYLALLEAADAARWNDYDGRGARSQRALTEFSQFFLETCLDQVRYMRSLLEVDSLADRIAAYVERRAAGGLGTRLARPAVHLLHEALWRGEVPRGEAARLTGLSERAARMIVSQLTKEGLLVSDRPKTPVRLGFPVAVVPYYFPQLYPEDAVRDV